MKQLLLLIISICSTQTIHPGYFTATVTTHESFRPSSETTSSQPSSPKPYNPIKEELYQQLNACTNHNNYAQVNNYLPSQAIPQQQQAAHNGQQQVFAEQKKQASIQHNIAVQEVRTIEVHEKINAAVAEWRELSELNTMSAAINPTTIKNRIEAITQLQNGEFEMTRVTHTMLPASIQLLNRYGYDEALYLICEGNQLQHIIHEDCLDLVDATAALTHKNGSGEFQHAVIETIDAARESNQSGCTYDAMYVTDFCWALLEHAEVFIRKAVVGGIEGAYDLATHPLETLACVVLGRRVLYYQLLKLLTNVADIGFTYSENPQAGIDKLNKYIQPVTKLINAIKTKQLSSKDYVGGGAQIAGYLAVQYKLLGGLNKMFEMAKVGLLKFIEENPLASPENFFATPEGIIIDAVHEVATAPEDIQRNLYYAMEQVNNVKPRNSKVIIQPGGELCEFTEKAIDDGLKYVVDNKMIHIFGDEGHLLDPIVSQLGGEENMIREVLKVLSGKVKFDDFFYDLRLNVAEHQVYVRGVVMEGIPKLGTVFIKQGAQ